jgi:hypothetical protein
MPNGMSVKNAGHDKLNESINVIRRPFQRTLEIHQFAIRVDVEEERKGGLKPSNVDRALEVDELHTERYLRNIGRTQTSLRQPYQ